METPRVTLAKQLVSYARLNEEQKFFVTLAQSVSESDTVWAESLGLIGAVGKLALLGYANGQTGVEESILRAVAEESRQEFAKWPFVFKNLPSYAAFEYATIPFRSQVGERLNKVAPEIVSPEITIAMCSMNTVKLLDAEQGSEWRGLGTSFEECLDLCIKEIEES